MNKKFAYLISTGKKRTKQNCYYPKWGKGTRLKMKHWWHNSKTLLNKQIIFYPKHLSPKKRNPIILNSHHLVYHKICVCNVDFLFGGYHCCNPSHDVACYHCPNLSMETNRSRQPVNSSVQLETGKGAAVGRQIGETFYQLSRKFVWRYYEIIRKHWQR